MWQFQDWTKRAHEKHNVRKIETNGERIDKNQFIYLFERKGKKKTKGEKSIYFFDTNRKRLIN